MPRAGRCKPVDKQTEDRHLGLRVCALRNPSALSSRGALDGEQPVAVRLRRLDNEVPLERSPSSNSVLDADGTAPNHAQIRAALS
jgi:hypothetical protein